MARQPKSPKTPADVLGAILKDARRDAGITQEALADGLGLAGNTVIGRLEAGERDMLLVEFVRFCDTVKRDPVDLFQEFLVKTKNMPLTTVREIKRMERDGK